MKKVWDNRWKKVMIWLSGYLSFIAYAVIGGYVIVKSEDEDLRKTAKDALIVTLIFAAFSALYTILSSINSKAGYNKGFSEFLSWYSFLQMIAEIVVYTVFIVLSLFFDTDGSTQTTALKENTDGSTQAPAQKENTDGAAAAQKENAPQVVGGGSEPQPPEKEE